MFCQWKINELDKEYQFGSLGDIENLNSFFLIQKQGRGPNIGCSLFKRKKLNRTKQKFKITLQD